MCHTHNVTFGPRLLENTLLSRKEYRRSIRLWCVMPQKIENPFVFFHEFKKNGVWQTLRKDVKRLRSDLSDTGDDTSSYEGVLGDLTAAALRASDTDGDFDAIAAAIPEENPGQISHSFPCEETISTSLANNRGGNDVPPTKRQKGWDRDLSSLRGNSGSSLSSFVPKGVSRAASEDSGDSFGVRASSNMMVVRTPEEIAMMDEDQLRQQVLTQLRVIEAMSKRIEALEQEQGRTKESFSSPFSVSSGGAVG